MALNHQGVYVVVDYKLGIMETRFAELIWNREPITSGELVKLCERELEWKNRQPIPCCADFASGIFFKTKMAW